MKLIPVRVALLWSLLASTPVLAADSPITFVTHRLGQVRSEAVGVADFNGDGKLDVVAGPSLYLAPDWKALKIRTLSGEVDPQGKGYVDDFMNLPLDVDRDGRVDVVSCGWFCKCIRWYRNTLGGTTDWPEQVVDTSANYEAGDLADIDGDGKANEILAHCPATVWYEALPVASGAPVLTQHVVSNKAMNYGGGVGDLNGDGRPDILRPDAWFEAPSNPRTGT